jgi:ubiquinone/menaquinone biosynthesis C-methylase UbiE
MPLLKIKDHMKRNSSVILIGFALLGSLSAADHFTGNDAPRTIWGQSLIKRMKTHALPVSVLEIECGAGELTSLLAQENSQGVVTGLDSNSTALSTARKKHSAPNILWRQGSIEDLSKEQHSFNIVTSFSTSPWCPDINRTLEALFCVVAKQGYGYFMLAGKRDDNSKDPLTQAVDQQLNSVKWRSIFEKHRIQSLDDTMRLYTAAQFRDACQQAGFKVRHCQLVETEDMFASKACFTAWLNVASSFEKQLGIRHNEFLRDVTDTYVDIIPLTQNGTLCYQDRILQVIVEKE